MIGSQDPAALVPTCLGASSCSNTHACASHCMQLQFGKHAANKITLNAHHLSFAHAHVHAKHSWHSSTHAKFSQAVKILRVVSPRVMIDFGSAGENVVKNTGLGYTVIRAGPLLEEPGGYKALIFDQVLSVCCIMQKWDMACPEYGLSEY